MYKKVLLPIFCINFALASYANGLMKCQESIQSTRTMIISDIEFSHLVSCHHGVMREEFLVNGVPLEKEEYRKKLENIQMQQLRYDEDKKIEQDKKRMAWQQDISCVLAEKTVKQHLEKVRSTLSFFEHDILIPYIVYSQSGLIKNRSCFADIIQSCDVWQRQIGDMVHKQDLVSLDKMAQQLEQINQEIDVVMDLSIKNAIARCDDTRVLKLLLDMVKQ